MSLIANFGDPINRGNFLTSFDTLGLNRRLSTNQRRFHSVPRRRTFCTEMSNLFNDDDEMLTQLEALQEENLKNRLQNTIEEQKPKKKPSAVRLFVK